MCGGELTEDSSSSLFGASNLFGFAIFSQADVEDLFLVSRHKLFLAGGHKALSRAELDALSCGQTFRLSVSRQLLRSVFLAGSC
jgi:hypothetical protein